MDNSFIHNQLAYPTPWPQKFQVKWHTLCTNKRITSNKTTLNGALRDEPKAGPAAREETGQPVHRGFGAVPDCGPPGSFK